MPRIPVEFYKRADGLAWLLVLSNAGVVLFAGVAAWHVDVWWAYALVFVLVGARGQACYILQHEALHGLLFASKRLNDAVGVALSVLLGTQFHAGRRVHMDHHRAVGSPDDPNEFFHNVERRPPGWPTLRFFAWHLLGARLLGVFGNLLSGLRRLAGIAPANPPGGSGIPLSRVRIDLIALLLGQLAILAGISLLASPQVYLLLYLLPLASLTALFEALRSFSEHMLPGAARNEPEAARRFFMRAGPIERFFISQFDFHFHHVHHLYPNVPTSRIRKLHDWLAANDPAFESRFLRRRGYVATAIAYLMNRPIAGGGDGYPLPA